METEAKRVLIVGASKGVGLEAVRAALAQGYQVRALARSAGSIPIDNPLLEKQPGDARDAADIRAALEGVDAVILALGVAAGPRMVLAQTSLFSDATRVLLPAMQAAGVRRLVCVTGFGAGDSRGGIGCLGRLPFEAILGRVYADKDRQEQLIRDSGLDWTIVRPGVLTNRRSTGRPRVLVERESWRNGVIGRADVARFLVDQVDDESLIGKTPALIG